MVENERENLPLSTGWNTEDFVVREGIALRGESEENISEEAVDVREGLSENRFAVTRAWAGVALVALLVGIVGISN